MLHYENAVYLTTAVSLSSLMVLAVALVVFARSLNSPGFFILALVSLLQGVLVILLSLSVAPGNSAHIALLLLGPVAALLGMANYLLHRGKGRRIGLAVVLAASTGALLALITESEFFLEANKVFWALGWLGAAYFVWRHRDRKSPLGFYLIAAGFLLTPLAFIVLWRSGLLAALVTVQQLLNLLVLLGVLLAAVQSEQLRSDMINALQKRALLRLVRNRRRMVQLREWTDVLLKQVSDGVIVSDMDGMITGFNVGAEQIFGRRSEDVIGQPVTLLIREEMLPAEGMPMNEFLLSLRDRYNVPRELRGQRADGEVIDLEMVVSSVSISDQQQMIGIVRDISERRRQQTRLEFMAHHDALTGLVNRRWFEQRLEERLTEQRTGVVVFVDLDDFKLVNDSLGHRAGDRALCCIAERLTEVAGKGALVSRQSGDEFVLHLPHLNELQQVREWAGQCVAQIRAPMEFEGKIFSLSCSVGFTLCGEGGSAEALIRQADLAMYHSKRVGKNRFSQYSGKMLQESIRTSELGTRLKSAGLDRELYLVFQPRVSLHDRGLAGAEVLVRWRTPQGDEISPAEFIPIAEQTGQILRLGYWVLEKACENLSRWSHLREALVLSINLSPRQLFDESLVDRIEEVRTRHGLSAAQLEFEITEGSAMHDMEYALRILGRLRALGYGLSLDDFGTGFSSLSYLRHLPVNTVKLDRSFIKDLISDRQQRVLVAGMIELSGMLGIRVLAEGVENQEQLTMLDSFGCDEAQGFLLGRPVPAEVFHRDVLLGWDEMMLKF